LHKYAKETVSHTRTVMTVYNVTVFVY